MKNCSDPGQINSPKEFFVVCQMWMQSCNVTDGRQMKSYKSFLMCMKN